MKKLGVQFQITFSFSSKVKADSKFSLVKVIFSLRVKPKNLLGDKNLLSIHLQRWVF